MKRQIHGRPTYALWAPSFCGFGGGITAFSRELARALTVHGFALRLLGKADRGGEWEGLPLWGGRASTLSFAVTGVVMGATIRPDFLISTHLNFGPAVRYAARAGGCRYALVAHGIDVSPELSPARLAALRAADQVIAVSQWTRARVLALGGVEPGRVKLLPNTYNDERFTVASVNHQLRQRYGISESEKVILTVTRMDPSEGYKGYDRILQVLPSVRNACGPVRYIIAGTGGDRRRLEILAHGLGVSQAVTFAGFVPDEELADHYRLADVFAMPSSGEGFGIVFLESMGCGTTVLGGNLDGSVDALDGGNLGLLVDPTSNKAIADGLVSLLRREGPELWFDRSRLSSAVNELYGREAFRRRVAELFG